MEEKTTHGTGETCCNNSLLTSTRVQGALTLVLILLAAFLFASTINALKEYRYIGGGVSPSNTVSVSGEGEVFAVPDTAEFTFTIQEESQTASEVQQQAAEKVNAAIAALTAAGIEEADIKTVAYNLQPKYRFEPEVCPQFGRCDRERIQDGFSLDQSVRVLVREMDRSGSVIASLGDLEVSSVSGVSFTIDDADAVRAEARSLAIEDARAKAEALADDLGVNLVRIVGFYENDAPMPYMRAAASDMALGLGGGAEVQEAVLPAGENQIVSRVNVVYEIR